MATGVEPGTTSPNRYDIDHCPPLWDRQETQIRSTITVERSYPMSSPRNTSVSAARVVNVAIDPVEQQKERLRGILESKQATPDEKFAAIVDLARLAGIGLREKAEAEEPPD